MTVESDGSGGMPVDGGTVGRLLDRSGNGIHLSQPTVNQRPTAQNGYLAFPNVIGGMRPSLLSVVNAISSWSRQAHSGVFIAQCVGIGDDGTPLDLDATNIDGFILWQSSGANDGKYRIFNGDIKTTGLTWAQLNTYVAWRSRVDGFDIEIDGVRAAMPVLVGDHLSSIVLGREGGGAPQKMRFFEMALADSALSDDDFNSMCAYARRVSGFNTRTEDALLCIGDSLTGGAGTLTQSPYVNLLTHMATAHKYVLSREGYFAYAWETTYPVATFSPMYKRAGRNVVVVWLGTNDLAVPKTPAEIEAALNGICTGYRTRGWKVVVCTLQDKVGQTANIATLNGLLRANYAGYADALADLGANANLQNSADPVYFTSDEVHLTDAGQAVVAGIVDAAIASIP
jgi:lysophospholipase L1-like esterase